MAVATTVVLGCAPSTSDGAEGALEQGLVHSLNVHVEPEAVRFTLQLTNASGSAAVVTFPTAQRYDFVVETPAGAEVWRWSADRVFAQVVESDTLAAGATELYEAAWAVVGRRPGRYMAVGRVTSSSTPVELRTEFEIPES